MFPEDLDERHLRLVLVGEDLLERGALADGLADEDADRPHHDAEQERNSPTPAEECLARQHGDQGQRPGRQQRSGRGCGLRQTRPESTPLTWGMLYGEQCGTA